VAQVRLYPVKLDRNRLYWRVVIPTGPMGVRKVTLKGKAKALALQRAAQRELRRTKKIDFLTCPRLLLDALEGLRMMEVAGVPGRYKMRRAAALLILCQEEIAKDPEGFTTPLTRSIELPPQLYRGLERLSREKGCDLNDLVVSLLWQYLGAESEKKIKTYPNEEKIPLRCLL
jgi:hypothetical protein